MAETGMMLLAHADGFSWDELALVLAPMVVLGLILVLATRRVKRQAAIRREASDREASAHRGEASGSGNQTP